MPTRWPHAPLHRLGAAGTFIVTAATYQQAHRFRSEARLRLLHDALLRLADESGWHLEAWAVFSNHYHFVAQSPAEGATTLRTILRRLHAYTATAINRLDATPGRRVWHNYWERQITSETAHFARLAYVHRNAVKHGLVADAEAYPWCSAAWFARTASPAQVLTLAAVKIDRVNVHDYAPLSAE